MFLRPASVAWPSAFLRGRQAGAIRPAPRRRHPAARDHQRERPEADGDRGRQTRRGLSGLDLEVRPRRSLGQHGDAARLAAGRGENRRPRASSGRSSTSAVSPAKFFNPTRPAAIRSSPASSGCAGSSGRTPTPLIAASTSTAPPEEKIIGKPASYGCVRMCSKDVTEVYAQLQIGALVRIIPDSLPKLPKLKRQPSKVIFTAEPRPNRPLNRLADAPRRRRRKQASSATNARAGSGA